MKLDEIKKSLETAEYDFLRTNEHLGRNIILLGLGGSHAYGTETETSDLDIRGCALSRKDEKKHLSSTCSLANTCSMGILCSQNIALHK